MTREVLERYQILVYLAAIGCGLAVGTVLEGRTGVLESLLWPVLALLLYVTFVQVPLTHLRKALADSRFVTAAVIGNFLIVPVVVWGLMTMVPHDPAIRLGVLLVLLVPCTDWFITFAHLGGGDARHAIAFSPVSLLLQILLLPLYLWLFLGEAVTAAVAQREMLAAFCGLILLPLFAAFLTQKWAEKNAGKKQFLAPIAWLPVSLLAVVVFIIAAIQVSLVAGSLGTLRQLLLVFVVFLVIAGLLARVLASFFRLPAPQGRVLAFSLGTRNSFVVLPLALALPSSFELAAVVIIFQSLVELLGMVVYLWWVPKKLFPDRH